ncbi:MAG: LAGLIDADG family homing endonuclease [Halanaeroarchaeum sp.]
MAEDRDQELVDRFESFYRQYYADEIAELARKYPRERKSLVVDWGDLFRFDPDFADDLVDYPDRFRDAAEEALRLYDLPVDVSLASAHVRFENLDAVTEIREIRADHINTLVSVRGIVRKATNVRPKIQEATFVCQRCGAETVVPQTEAGFQEPYQCESCERQGPFQLEAEQSEFVDAQKLRVQESPEGLGGGETPQAVDMNVEDDLTGQVTAGDHVTATGVLRLDQGKESSDSPVFDVYLEGVSIEIEDEEFEDMDITQADKERIVELSEAEDIYEKIVDSIAPAIYGYEQAKLAMALQLFSGVTKHLPDGSRIRGDLHMLLIGDPGTGKCVTGDTNVTLADGTRRPIRDIVEAELDDPKPVDDGVYDEAAIPLPTMDASGDVTIGRATKVWKREAPDRLYRIALVDGTTLEVTPSHPLFIQDGGHPTPVKAEELAEGMVVATANEIETTDENSINQSYRRSKSHNAVRLQLPDSWTPSLARFVGYVVAEGYVEKRADNTGFVSITNTDEEILEDVRETLDELGLNYFERGTADTPHEIISSAGELVNFLEAIEPATLEESAEQRIPDTILQASTEIIGEFLRAFVDAEGHVSTSEREITVASMSRDLLFDVKIALLHHGIRSSIHPRDNGSHRLRISGNSFSKFINRIGLITERKREAAGHIDSGSRNTNVDTVPNVGGKLERIRRRLGLTQSECGLPRSTYQHYERGDRNPSVESLEKVLGAFERRITELKESREHLQSAGWDEVKSVRKRLNLSQAVLADTVGVEQTSVSLYDRGEVVPDGGRIDAAKASLSDRLTEAIAVQHDVETLRTITEGSIGWTEIADIETVEPDENWVYDLEVQDTHNYLTEHVVSHNSQLLQYIRNIAPRSVYTSGKGSSSAGLTAAAVRDDFGDGQQWTLEAGALVLADQGIAAVDELDKMRSEDRSAMHEALEQQSISISKAGINATLKARCSLLGAANPKYGRFDQYEPMGEQIDLEPALISRFDLIFTVTDQPDEERDAALADHILQTNYAGELHTHRENVTTSSVADEEIEDATEEVEPVIDSDLLRKYVAYARRNAFPTMTSAARSAIEDFYVDLRSKGQDEDAPVPVTARKLEALVRLAEASARARLSDTVEEEDAERVIEVVRTSLEAVGVDPETDQYDADMIETGTSKSQRDRIRNIKSLIEDVEDEFEEGAPVDEIMARAEEGGMDREKAEHEIEKLKQRGEVYEPSTDHLRTT